jgi:hypothetical protein
MLVWVKRRFKWKVVKVGHRFEHYSDHWISCKYSLFVILVSSRIYGIMSTVWNFILCLNGILQNPLAGGILLLMRNIISGEEGGSWTFIPWAESEPATHLLETNTPTPTGPFEPNEEFIFQTGWNRSSCTNLIKYFSPSRKVTKNKIGV